MWPSKERGKLLEEKSKYQEQSVGNIELKVHNQWLHEDCSES
jgi:hypothetical protein